MNTRRDGVRTLVRTASIEVSDIEDADLRHKYQRLEEILAGFENVLLAFSAGVDSTFLLQSALKVKGRDNVLAVTADSPIRSREKLQASRRLTEKMDVEHRVIETAELENDDFASNEPDRCYHCKHILYGKLLEIAAENDIGSVLDGTNADDLEGAHRPGYDVLEELDIRAPLEEAGLKKKEIRKLSRLAGLPTWDQPSDTCYATRVDYELELDKDLIDKVREMEKIIAESGEFEQLRARIHDDNTVRIEVLPKNMNKIMDLRPEIAAAAREMGFTYVTLDLQGYRQGSINEK